MNCNITSLSQWERAVFLKAVYFLFADILRTAVSSGTSITQRAMVTVRQLEGAWGAKQTLFVYERAGEKKRGGERVV